MHVLITLARMAYTKRLSPIVYKSDAASWALPELPRGLGSELELARRIYVGDTGPTEIRADSATLATVQELAALIADD